MSASSPVSAFTYPALPPPRPKRATEAQARSAKATAMPPVVADIDLPVLSVESRATAPLACRLASPVESHAPAAEKRLSEAGIGFHSVRSRKSSGFVWQARHSVRPSARLRSVCTLSRVSCWRRTGGGEAMAGGGATGGRGRGSGDGRGGGGEARVPPPEAT